MKSLGDQAVGLRNPCVQLDCFQPSLMLYGVLDKDKVSNILRKAGIMSIVISDGVVSIGDRIRVELPPQPYRSLEKV